MTSFKQTIIILWVLCINICDFAQANIIQVSNWVEPVSFFVNHKDVFNEVDNKLKLFNTVTIVGISGIGKTQIARMYTRKHNKNYGSAPL